MSEYTVYKIIDKKHRCLGSRNKCGVYKITNIQNKKFYIGSSKTILQRWRNHIRELESNTHKNMFLQADWNEYGKDNFIFEILEECAESDRYQIEQQYLDKFMPFYRSEKGYNISEKSTQRNESNVRLFQSKETSDDYYIVKVKGCKPYVMDGEHCRNTSREDLKDECYALKTFDEIRRYMLEANGYDDDWC